MSDDVKSRLRAVRLHFGLSQRALAKRAGVPSSSVSLIEGGKVSPSVGSLKRLVDAMGMSLAEFFSFEAPQHDQIFFRADELLPIAQGAVSYRQVGHDLSRSLLQILCETYQPGADSGRVRLSHEGEEGGVVISGQLEVTVGEEKRLLGPGDAYLFRSEVPHRFRNIAEAPCVLITACTPPTF
ncbi:cupin domain-containing protein [Phenylobacterium immobile]|uniref:cupin domain-containing protein n=1 Tax=Phenylobacterium immobile TaxID=21 RepID=UPI000ADD0FA5|nr:cupin domain-containing protein [Phenylobacterium immobile]